ncbi:MAG: hydrolase [candidate division Zixibacteria bacterium]|nr:hydrolase [candidate division Zixibacteria bacterium]MBU1471492.1 hydrolase [candidate division Zixibacteria bacterium]MBU2625522.1 hydrolase [candidate division Zixibacteria bacterium]
MLTLDNSFMLLVDMQGKLAGLMHKRKDLVESLTKLIQGVRILELPIVWMEQYPKGLGETIPEIKSLLDGLTPHAKTSFGCGGDENIMNAIRGLNRKQAIVAGIETHVCVYQSCKQLLEEGFGVTLVTDCTSSRTKFNRRMGISALSDAGVMLSTVEMTLFELLHKAEGDKFKQISQLVK